jgi:tRNA(Ile)-lysidine synthase
LSHALLQRVRRAIRRYDLLPPGSTVLVGLSGGSDSVALTLLLVDLARHGDFRVTGLAHLNHQIRPEAPRDEAFCRDFAARLGLPFFVETIDVPGYAAAQRLSVEDAARRLRYDFLSRVAGQAGATVVAVGHTQDDQAETFLLKLARGAGLTGLGAIYPRRDSVIRPLIDVSRADLQACLRARGETWVDDASNADVANPRNRVRHRILPELEVLYGGSTRPALARAAGLVREDGTWLDEEAGRRYDAICKPGPGTVEMLASRLLAEPPPLRRRVLLRALRSLAGPREVGLEHVESALEVLAGLAPAADLPGARVELTGEKLVLIQRDAGSK